MVLAEGATLGHVSNPRGAPIYVGKSSNLSQREIDTHFADGKTGFSTLRRSLGAIIKEQLALRATPRGTGPSKSNYTAYCFDGDGEGRLSAWMVKNLRVGVHPFDFVSLAEREAELIALACPPLNRTGWPNPEAAHIRELRKVCADEARRMHRT